MSAVALLPSITTAGIRDIQANLEVAMTGNPILRRAREALIIAEMDLANARRCTANEAALSKVERALEALR